MRKVTITERIKDNKIIYGLNISGNETAISFPEITDNKEQAEQLCQKLSDEDISFVHIQDIVKDFIAEGVCDKLIANSLL